ncbi:MAG TPA: 23S rRNA (pseudouridine(1915)-N(3))-methyltransferase RlmH [Sandaracinaceae bacterium LLY-WYZ-13_1]|nr:23S rRNA (pseudouridine(1915)-N(3))-methyltransferase RlmH [Sandaracinaceae bacterium LLY-WYZ-13_1]
MRVAIVAVGKVKERPLRKVLDDYLGRIGRYAKLAEVELKDESPDRLRARFAKAIDADGRTVALEVDGQAWSSHRLADFVGDCELHAVPTISFLIGGAYGLPEEVSHAADVRLSLSAMTLPHRLARVVLAEQIYRAFTILRGEPYSH